MEKDKYSNPLIGFELPLERVCTYDKEEEAIAFSTRLPERLSLRLRCGQNLLVIGSFPLYHDEDTNLLVVGKPSLNGTIDGCGLRRGVIGTTNQ